MWGTDALPMLLTSMSVRCFFLFWAGKEEEGGEGGERRPSHPGVARMNGDEIHVRVKDITTGQEVFVALGRWDTVGVLKKRLEGKGMGGFDAQRLVHAGRILDNDETLMAAGVAKQPQVRMW